MVIRTTLELFQQKLHFCSEEMVNHMTFFVDFWKICNYQSHPYLLWKSFNIVRITLV